MHNPMTFNPAAKPVDPIPYFKGALPDHPEFTDIYWASLDPELRVLRTMDAGPKRMQEAYKLAEAGHIVDAEIMAEGLDPWKIFAWRSHYGYPWVPSALMLSPSAVPGFTQPTHPPPGTQNYDWSMNFDDAVKKYGPLIEVPKFYEDVHKQPQIDTSIFPASKEPAKEAAKEPAKKSTK